MNACKIDGCEKPVHVKKYGWCAGHYHRWRRHGDPMGGAPSPAKTPEEAFESRTAPEGDCLAWIGARSGGYGQLRAGGRSIPAHRYAWERVNGPIPAGMVVDHRCHNPSCVKVAHLRLATHAENIAHRSGRQRNRTQDLPRGVVRHGARFRVWVRGEHIGLYATEAEASAAAVEARRTAFGDFAGGV